MDIDNRRPAETAADLLPIVRPPITEHRVMTHWLWMVGDGFGHLVRVWVLALPSRGLRDLGHAYRALRH